MAALQQRGKRKRQAKRKGKRDQGYFAGAHVEEIRGWAKKGMFVAGTKAAKRAVKLSVLQTTSKGPRLGRSIKKAGLSTRTPTFKARSGLSTRGFRTKKGRKAKRITF